jgi:DNA-binding beta-propeller fold protein YncE
MLWSKAIGAGGALKKGWDISTAVFLHKFNVAPPEFSPNAVFFHPEGTKMYVVGDSTDAAREYNLSTAWDVSTAVFVQQIGVGFNPYGIFFKTDGLKMYIITTSNDTIREYDISTPWDVSTAVLFQTRALGQESAHRAIFFRDDGLKLYTVGLNNDRVYEYNLGTAWNISTLVFSQSLLISGQDGLPVGLFFKPDGLKMYVTGLNGNRVYEYDLSTAWDVQTASYVQFFNPSAQETSPRGVFFKPDGLKMFIIGQSSDAVNEYNLTA